MNATASRLDLLSAAVSSIAAALPAPVARRAADQLLIHVDSLPMPPQDEDADAALAADLARLMAALAEAARTVPE